MWISGAIWKNPDERSSKGLAGTLVLNAQWYQMDFRPMQGVEDSSGLESFAVWLCIFIGPLTISQLWNNKN